MSKKIKLNIAIVCDPITDYTAGSFVSTLRFAELLHKKGHKVIFIAAKSPKNVSTNFYNDIKVYRFFSILLPKTENQMYISLPTLRQVKKILTDEKIDIVHSIIPTPSSIVCIKAAKQLGIKVVIHSHAQPENIFHHLPKAIRTKTLNVMFYKLIYLLYKQADALIYPTEFAKNLFIDINRKVKSTVISNGVNLERFKREDPSAFKEKFKIPDGRIILYVGRLHPEKSVETLIKGFAKIKSTISDVHLVIVGEGHQEQSLKNLAKKVCQKDSYTFCGKASNDEVVMAYNIASLFVLPSLAELEGMVVLEAMACENPILIANSKDSASTFFVKDNGFLFDAENHEDLADKAINILQDEPRRLQMAATSLALGRSLDINRSTDQLVELYRSLL